MYKPKKVRFGGGASPPSTPLRVAPPTRSRLVFLPPPPLKVARDIVFLFLILQLLSPVSKCKNQKILCKIKKFFVIMTYVRQFMFEVLKQTSLGSKFIPSELVLTSPKS
jgi:hypothetical protein